MILEISVIFVLLLISVKSVKSLASYYKFAASITFVQRIKSNDIRFNRVQKFRIGHVQL